MKHVFRQRQRAEDAEIRVDAFDSVPVHEDEIGGRILPVHQLRDPDTLRAKFNDEPLLRPGRPIKQAHCGAKQLSGLPLGEAAFAALVIYRAKDVRLRKTFRIIEAAPHLAHQR